MENIVMLWLEGVKILLPFLGLGVAIVFGAYWAILVVDLMAVIIGCSKDLEIIKFFLPKKVYDKLNNCLSNKRENKRK